MAQGRGVREGRKYQGLTDVGGCIHARKWTKQAKRAKRAKPRMQGLRGRRGLRELRAQAWVEKAEKAGLTSPGSVEPTIRMSKRSSFGAKVAPQPPLPPPAPSAAALPSACPRRMTTAAVVGRSMGGKLVALR